MPGNTGSNGRVTMALLGQKLDTVIVQQSELSKEFREHLTQSAKRDTDISLLNQCVNGENGLVDSVKNVNNRIDGMKRFSIIGDSIVAGLAALGAFLWGNR